VAGWEGFAASHLALDAADPESPRHNRSDPELGSRIAHALERIAAKQVGPTDTVDAEVVDAVDEVDGSPSAQLASAAGAASLDTPTPGPLSVGTGVPRRLKWARARAA
jgi:hypothetical protein